MMHGQNNIKDRFNLNLYLWITTTESNRIAGLQWRSLQ